MRQLPGSVRTHRYDSAFAQILQAWLWPLKALRHTEGWRQRKGVANLPRCRGPYGRDSAAGCGSECRAGAKAGVEFRAMSPARTPDPDPDAEARRRRQATAKAKKLLLEGLARLQTVLDDRFITDETRLEASVAMQLAADAMHAALRQLDAADSIGHHDAAVSSRPEWMPPPLLRVSSSG